MAKRIFYRPVSGIEYMHRSIETYNHNTNGGRFTVFLNTADLTFRIYDETAGLDAATGSVPKDTTTFHKLKIAAKKALIELGVEGLESEQRGPRGKYKTTEQQ